jgi:hypothetical protein
MALHIFGLTRLDGTGYTRTRRRPSSALRELGAWRRLAANHFRAVHPCDVVIEDEQQLSDFEGGNLEVVLREEILDPVPDDISGFQW